MPHQCVRCGRIYPDAAKQLIQGCDDCHGRFFFFIRKEAMIKKAEKIRDSFSDDQIKEMEDDVRGIVNGTLEEEMPVILDLETIHMLAPGKYEVDISSLMRGKPVIVNVGDGKYFIDIFTLFDKNKKSRID